MGAARLRSYNEITPLSLFLYVSRSHTRYGFRADARAFRFSVNAIKDGTVVLGRHNVIVRWGYYCKIYVQLYKSEFPCCSVTTGSRYIYLFIYSAFHASAS